MASWQIGDGRWEMAGISKRNIEHRTFNMESKGTGRFFTGSVRTFQWLWPGCMKSL